MQVVERDEQPLHGRKRPKRCDHGQAEPERIDRVRLVRVDPSQSDVERPLLRGRQIELRRLYGLEQVGEDAERKFCLRLGRTGGERSEAGRLGPGNRLLQQRRLAVAGATPEREHPVPLGHRPEELVDRRELRVASDERRHVTDSRPVRRENPVESPDVSAAPCP